MNQTLVNLYVDEEVRRLERERPTHAERHRRAWLLGEARTRARRHRIAARWLGDGLVAAGEWLRSWSAIEIGPPAVDTARHPNR